MRTRDLWCVPLSVDEANTVVAAYHRHHDPVPGHRYSIGAVTPGGHVVAAIIVGRPVSRLLDPAEVAEVTRLASDGTPNACSVLYAAAARTAKAMGFRRIQTFTLATETGASLRAAGWVAETQTAGGSWHRPSRTRTDTHPTGAKTRWAVTFTRPALTLIFPTPTTPTTQQPLFGGTP